MKCQDASEPGLGFCGSIDVVQNIRLPAEHGPVDPAADLGGNVAAGFHILGN